MIVTDETVYSHYASHFPDFPIIILKEGEENKNLNSVEQLYKEFLNHKIDRSSLIVAVGGGIVCDIAGFAAATYMRGVAFATVPTTLLAQVDAAIGGKNGVNFSSFKNMIGTIRQPEFVLIDSLFLQTLSMRHTRNGFVEMIKHAIVCDSQLFEFIEKNKDSLFDFTSQEFEKALHDAIVVKVAVVEKDEKERSLRKILNFGHTIGHAIEATRTDILHGEAVAVGMIHATRIARQRGLVSEKELERICSLIRFFSPVAEIDMEKIFPALFADKKKREGRIDFIFPNGIGNAIIVPLTEEEIVQ